MDRMEETNIRHRRTRLPNLFDKRRPVFDQEGRAFNVMESISIQELRGPYGDKALFWCGYVSFVRGNFEDAERFFAQLNELRRESPLRSVAADYRVQAKMNDIGGAIEAARNIPKVPYENSDKSFARIGPFIAALAGLDPRLGQTFGSLVDADGKPVLDDNPRIPSIDLPINPLAPEGVGAPASIPEPLAPPKLPPARAAESMVPPTPPVLPYSS